MRNIINKLAIPHVESPFFKQLFDAEHPYYSYAKAMNCDGYAVINADQLFSTTNYVDTLVKEIRKKFQKRDIPKRIQDLNNSVSMIDQFNNHPKLIELLEYLYGRKPFPFQTLHFTKGTEQHFHSDATHFNSIPERYMCGVWLALEDIGENQGPLEYYPGSHKFPIFENEHIGIDLLVAEKVGQEPYERLWRELMQTAGITSKNFMAKKGDILIWTANLLHGGSKHLDDKKSRLSQVTHYYFDDCTYYSPMDSDKQYGFIKQRLNNADDSLDSKLHSSRRDIVDDFRESYQSLIDQHRDLPKDFDGERYLSLHADVKDGGMNPVTHYILFGRGEGRPYK